MTLAAFLALFGPYMVALLALGGTIYSIRSQRGKVSSDAAASIAEASSMTINDLKEELARINLKIAAQLLQVQDLRISTKRTLELIARLLQGITLLLDQLHHAGLAPAWIPDPEIERLIKLCTEDSDRLAIPRSSLNQGSTTKL